MREEAVRRGPPEIGNRPRGFLEVDGEEGEDGAALETDAAALGFHDLAADVRAKVGVFAGAIVLDELDCVIPTFLYVMLSIATFL